ncbi:MAG TPA: hypothetical protein VMY37_40310 [Thermoguttaceae bacterium]|nr:hypothetical protein [Thermoguttaceae bacterium]
MLDSTKCEGPQKRIQAARKLWGDGDKEDAAALIFIAAAGISRIRQPKELGCSDRKAFTSFISDQVATITGGVCPKSLRFPRTCKLPGVKVTENVPLEDIFYGCWRCVMLHEARWPDEVYLTGTNAASKYSTSIELPPDGRLGLPESWILGLAYAVENAAEIILPQILRYPCFVVLSGPIDALPSGDFRFRPGETKVARVKVRNQPAVLVFTDKEKMRPFLEENEIPDRLIAQFSDCATLREFILYGSGNERFIFNPVVGEVPLPSYSLDCVVACLTN